MLEDKPLIPDVMPQANPQSDLIASLIGGQGGGLDLQSLLAAKTGGGPAGGLDLASLLTAQGGDIGDDRLNMLMRWLEQRSTTETQPHSVEEIPGPAEIELQRLEDMRQKRERQEEKRAQARELEKVMNSVYAELETLRARNDALAGALGACYLCFGDDLNCPECGGHGLPGALLPDETMFRQYVVPAVKRIQSSRMKTPGSLSSRTGERYQPRGDLTGSENDHPSSKRGE
jgi:hypothetical protein